VTLLLLPLVLVVVDCRMLLRLMMLAKESVN
jgi:hypothetical protein